MKKLLIKFFVGKNLPSLARAASTFLGGLLLASVVFDPTGVALDPALADAAGQVAVPSRAEIEDGVTFGEAVAVGSGILLVWLSRLFSFLRAKNLDWLAKGAGLVIGRSWVSASRAVLTLIASGLGFLTASPAARPEVVADQPITLGISALISFALARFLSATEDGKRNPVPSKP